MKRSRWIIRAVLLVAALALPVYGLALARGGHHHEFGGGHMRGGGPEGFSRVLEHNADRLKLDPSVLEQIKGIETDSRERNRGLFEQQRKEQDVLRAMLDADPMDENAILSQADRVGQLETDLRKEQLRSMVAMRRLLNPQQVAELRKIREERQASGPRHHRGHVQKEQQGSNPAQ